MHYVQDVRHFAAVVAVIATAILLLQVTGMTMRHFDFVPTPIRLGQKGVLSPLWAKPSKTAAVQPTDGYKGLSKNVSLTFNLSDERKKTLAFVKRSCNPNLAIKGTIFNYLKDYRNPCWLEKVDNSFKYDKNEYLRYFRRNHAKRQYNLVRAAFLKMENLLRQMDEDQKPITRLRCLPAFYIAGVHKAGTTDLYSAIIKHHLIKPTVVKESNFWSRSLQNGGFSFKDYLELYDTVAQEMRKNSHLITLDASPENFFLRNESQSDGNLKRPRFIANTIRALTPDTRIIILLRDPVTWLFSIYRQNVRMGRIKHYSPETFDKLICKDVYYFKKCVESKMTVRECVLTAFKSKSWNLHKSMYYVYVEEWLKIFPREQIFFLRAENYYVNRTESLEKVFTFLGIPPLSKSDSAEVESQKVKNKGIISKEKNSSMLSTTIQTIRNHVEPFNLKLAELLRDEQFKWRDQRYKQ